MVLDKQVIPMLIDCNLNLAIAIEKRPAYQVSKNADVHLDMYQDKFV
jgi:hypothetical protein